MDKVQIFVSYAHADAEPYPAFTASRVSRILEQIKYNLRCHDPRSEYKILRDAEGLLHVGDNIDDEINNAIEICDLGLIMFSKSYSRSEECFNEIKELLEKEKRIIIIELEDCWTDKYAKRLRKYSPDLGRTLREEFWGLKNGSVELYGHPLPELLSKEKMEYYDGALGRVVQSLETRGQEILDERQQRDHGSLLNVLPNHDVFLASPTADVRREVEWLETALQNDGRSVLRFDSRRHIAGELNAEEAINLAISKCNLSIQILGASPGGKYKGSEQNSVPLQHELCGADERPFHVWLSPEVEIGQSDYVDYNEFLKAAQPHQSSFEEFVQYVLKKVEKVTRNAESGTRRDIKLGHAGIENQAWPIVTLDVAQPDVEISDAIARAIQDQAYAETLDFDLDSARLEESVADSDGIIFVYSDSRAGQKRTQSHFKVISRYKNLNSKALFDLAIGNGLDEDSAKNAPPYPRGPEVHVISIDKDKLEVNPTELKKFLEEVKANAEHRYQ